MGEPVEVEVREPTGLGLGRFDLFSIRQKIYEGELHHQCEYLGDDGQWRPLATHPLFSGVFWLLGQDVDGSGARKTTRFKGWATKNSSADRPAQSINLEQSSTRLRLDQRDRRLKAREILDEENPAEDGALSPLPPEGD